LQRSSGTERLKRLVGVISSRTDGAMLKVDEAMQTQPLLSQKPVVVGKQRLLLVHGEKESLSLHDQRGLQLLDRPFKDFEFTALDIDLEVVHLSERGNVVEPRRLYAAA
jgi:hypothetical protein